MLASTRLTPRLSRLLWASALLRTRLETALERADRYASPQVFLGAALGMSDYGSSVVARHEKVARRYQASLTEVAHAASRWTTRVAQLNEEDHYELQCLGIDIEQIHALVSRPVGEAAPLSSGPTGPRLERLRTQLRRLEEDLRGAPLFQYR